ncbi:hypothetical protein P692DRAFT_20887806, partial [Suillus brevipes Sb2]
ANHHHRLSKSNGLRNRQTPRPRWLHSLHQPRRPLPAAHKRALDAGMINVPLPTLLSHSTWILSIIRSALGAPSSSGSNANTTSVLPRAFVDCNTVNLEMVKRIGGPFRETPVGSIDAGIVGTPPRDGWDPTFYACSESGSEELLEEFAALTQYRL